MVNEGKKFEQDFIKSIEIDYETWVYRLRDGTGNFAGTKNSNVRFQASNICDFLVMKNDTLFLLELKSCKESSIPLSMFRENQIKELSKINHKNIRTYFILNYRKYEKTYAIEAEKIQFFEKYYNRKSIPIMFCEEQGILIQQEKKKVRYKYNLDNFFKKEGEENA